MEEEARIAWNASEQVRASRATERGGEVAVVFGAGETAR